MTKKITDVNQLLLKTALLAAHPVGSFYWSEKNTDPGTLFGGTWEQIKDSFVLAAGDTYQAGATGGQADVTLTEDMIPAHSHNQNINGNGIDDWKNSQGRHVSLPQQSSGASGYAVNTNGLIWCGGSAMRIHTDATGGGKSHTNMPPYLVAYCWKRTA